MTYERITNNQWPPHTMRMSDIKRKYDLEMTQIKKNEDNQQGSKIDPFPECATRRGIVSAARARAPRSRAPPLVPGRPRRFGQKAHRWKSFDSGRLRASTVSAVANTASAAASRRGSEQTRQRASDYERVVILTKREDTHEKGRGKNSRMEKRRTKRNKGRREGEEKIRWAEREENK